MGLLAIIVAVIVIVAIIVIAIVSALSKSSEASAPAGEVKHNHAPGAENDGCAACKAAAEAIKTKVPEKCVVKFRPHAAWKGEFGFDWLREADTGFQGDLNYENIIGSYGADYATESTAVFTANIAKCQSLRDGYYNPFSISWKKDIKGNAYSYKTPWLSLYPKDECKGTSKKFEAKLKLYIEVVSKEPEVLRIDYNKDLFKVDKSEVIPKSIGDKGTMELTITCLKEFDKDQEIKVYPYKKGEHSLAGKLMVLKNSKANRTKANVIFVKVKTKLNAIGQEGKISDKKSLLEKYFYQSLTSLNSSEKVLNLSTKEDLKPDSALNVRWKLKLPASSKFGISAYLEDYTKIHGFLEKRFNDENPGFDKWFKIFIFEERGGYYTKDKGVFKYNGLDGMAAGLGTTNGNTSRSVIVFKDPAQSTTPHELLHSMGLFHTFDNKGLYTYKIGQTDNIMDYSDISTYSTPPKDQICTWKWQWDAIRPMLESE